MPTDFLMQQMQWREVIEDANTHHDIASLDALLNEVRSIAKSLALALNTQFNLKTYLDASETVRKLSFIDKIISDINHAIETLEN